MRDELFEILDMPKRIMRDIRDLESEKEAYKQTMLLSGISYDDVKIKTSPRDRMPEYIVRVESIEEKIEERQQAHLRACDKVKQLAEKLQGDEKSIIIQYYLEGKIYEEVAASLHMSVSQMYRYRKTAIMKLEKMVVNESEF